MKNLQLTNEQKTQLHEEVLYTQVRVKTKNAGGSGTVVYSKRNKKDYSTYVITCHHVIESALNVKDEYDPKIGMNRKKEYRQVITVEFFDYKNIPHGHRPISNSVDADIVAYDKDHDMALIKLRTVSEAPFVGKLLPKTSIEKVTSGMRCHAVGCALLHDPIITPGEITHMGTEIDYKDYWMSNASIIFGNSGGAVFLDGAEYYFIGIPSRIAISSWGKTPVTHLGYFSPITRVYEFLKTENFQFIYDDNYTEEQCEKTREDIKKKAQERRYRTTEGNAT